LLKQRVITAVILALVLTACIVSLSNLSLSAVFAVAVLIASWEWSRLSGLVNRIARLGFVLGCAVLMAAVAWFTQLFSDAPILERQQDILGLGCLWWALALLWVKGYPGSAALWGSVAVRVLMGYLVLVPAWLALAVLHAHEHGVPLLFILVALVASADIGAYFTGRAWGKAKLAPAVSPGKSWAGFWGGVASSSLFALLVWVFWWKESLPLAAVVAIALATALASVLGDLVESMVKRHQGVKDSGVILPGHGGVMDRLDSITAAAPVFALSLILAGW